MNQNEMEDLFLRSLDSSLSDEEKEKLAKAMDLDASFKENIKHYGSIRSSLLRGKSATFGPYFAQKVITRIQNVRAEIDQQIVFFFKKYQLAAVGVFVALLTVNVVFSDQVNIQSILGIEEVTTTDTPEDEIEEFDFLGALKSN
jgi:hypothetical protein